MRYSLEDIRGKRVAMVASTGGHLTQLTRLAGRLGVDPESPWVTFDTPQSRSLLRGREVHYVPYVRPRDYRGVARATRLLQPFMKAVDGAVSTGAGLALAVLPQIALRGKPAVYLESISRVQGPSLTGRILARVPRVGLYGQHSGWLTGPWRDGPSVLGQYRTRPVTAVSPRSIFVTLGTIRPYRFDRLIDTVLAYCRLHPEVDVLWQVGCTDRRDLPGRVVEQLTDAEFGEALGEHDLIVAHAGVGSALGALSVGRCPVLLPRSGRFDEAVDDHQVQIAEMLQSRGRAICVDPADLELDHLMRAAALRVTSSDSSHQMLLRTA